jgi:hypothetical protein
MHRSCVFISKIDILNEKKVLTSSDFLGPVRPLPPHPLRAGRVAQGGGGVLLPLLLVTRTAGRAGRGYK